jgi:hypothetical protein
MNKSGLKEVHTGLGTLVGNARVRKDSPSQDPRLLSRGKWYSMAFYLWILADNNYGKNFCSRMISPDSTEVFKWVWN